MKCFNHGDQEAVAHCPACGKAMCPACAKRFEPPLCEPCLLAHNREVAASLTRGLIATLVVFGVTTALFGAMTSGHGDPVAAYAVALFFGLLLACSYWGWRFLSERAPGFGFQNVLLHWAVKFPIAYFIGLFVGPYQIFRSIREIRTIRRVQGQIARGEI